MFLFDFNFKLNNLSDLPFIVYHDIILSNFNRVINIHLQVSILDQGITSQHITES